MHVHTRVSALPSYVDLAGGAFLLCSTAQRRSNEARAPIRRFSLLLRRFSCLPATVLTRGGGIPSVCHRPMCTVLLSNPTHPPTRRAALFRIALAAFHHPSSLGVKRHESARPPTNGVDLALGVLGARVCRVASTSYSCHHPILLQTHRAFTCRAPANGYRPYYSTRRSLTKTLGSRALSNRVLATRLESELLDLH